MSLSANTASCCNDDRHAAKASILPSLFNFAKAAGDVAVACVVPHAGGGMSNTRGTSAPALRSRSSPQLSPSAINSLSFTNSRSDCSSSSSDRIPKVTCCSSAGGLPGNSASIAALRSFTFDRSLTSTVICLHMSRKWFPKPVVTMNFFRVLGTPPVLRTRQRLKKRKKRLNEETPFMVKKNLRIRVGVDVYPFDQRIGLLSVASRRCGHLWVSLIVLNQTVIKVNWEETGNEEKGNTPLSSFRRATDNSTPRDSL
mmetsp:Transcript_17708/g.35963  ORF Transcript_17708/g.35963 Transcript_17708/m.35963 type:complete len:256 (-) Transcript_17708:67-834(-)